MSKKAMQQALEALQNIDKWLYTIGQKGLRDYEADAATALRDALAEESYDCPICKRSLPIKEGVITHDNVPHPEDFIYEGGDKARDVLNQCLNEMQYAGWNEPYKDNLGRWEAFNAALNYLHPPVTQVMQQALDALIIAEAGLADIGDADQEPGDDLAWCEARAAQALASPRNAIVALKAAIAQPVQLVLRAELQEAFAEGMSCRPASVQRPWVGLTVQEIGAIWDADGTSYIPEKQLQFYMDCETKLREKNI